MAAYTKFIYYIFCFLSITVFSSLSVQAAQDIYQFDNHAEEMRYQKLLLEVRCAVCQNQSLIDSNTELAEDLRREIYKMFNDGKSDADIKAFLVERYGPTILYNPPLQTNTLFLWLAPLLLALFGLAAWLWRNNKNKG